MKIVSAMVFATALLLNMALLDISPKTEVDENKFINVTTSKVLDGFLKNGFEIANNNDGSKPYVILNNSSTSDSGVKIYTTSRLAKVNGIFILVTLNEYTANKGADKSKRPLNEETFQNLKNALSALDGSDDVDFLRASFSTKDYEVIYTINGDNFDGIRKFFGFNKRSELLISIKPLDSTLDN